MYYRRANYLIEHGHRFDLFNAPDPGRELIRAFGYYMMRAATETGNLDVVAILGLEQWLCEHVASYAVEYLTNSSWLFERIMGGALGESIWGEISNHKYEEYADRELVNGCYYFPNENRESVTLRKSVQKHRTLIGRWLRTYSEKIVENVFSAACYAFDFFIQSVDAELYLMGHTHIPDLRVVKRSTIEGGHVVYGNSGAWLKFNDWFSFLSVKMDLKTGNATELKLMKWHCDFSEEKEKCHGVTMKQQEVPYVGKSLRRKDETSTAQHDEKKKRKVKLKLVNSNEKKGKKVPNGWICDPDFYGTDDGCDCNCGVVDPDCDADQMENVCVQTCDTICDGKEKIVEKE